MAFVSIKDFATGLAAKLRTVVVNTDENLTAHILHDSTGAEILGTKTDAKAPQTDTTALTYMQVWKQISASIQAVAAGVGSLMTVSQPMASGFTLVGLPSDQRWPTGMSPRSFAVAFTTLTRPANTTPYAAGDAISDNATPASVTALSATVSDTNDDPVTITDILVNSTDTGLGGKKLRAYLFNSDPTASSGVGGGDNLAYSQKKAGYIGSFMGWMETGFSDGTVGRLVPTFNETNNTQAGGFITAKVSAGGKNLWIQYQAVEAFTPSAASTTIIGTVRGYQARAS